MSKSRKSRSPLLPDRRIQKDFFLCDILDAVPKGDAASMEHPIFSVAGKPEMKARRYEHNGNYVEIRPSFHGLATIYDRDILIFCISQIMSALNEGKKVSRTVRFKACDLLLATNRGVDGRSYERLKVALQRLRGTSISTNILTGGKEIFRDFGLIESSEIVRETRDGRMQEVEVVLSDWVFNAIEANEVLTLHRDYFRLRRPLERRLYEIARKHCGNQPCWKIGLELLQKKCGSYSTKRKFRYFISEIAEQDREYHHLPDYSIDIQDDVVTFTNRQTMTRPVSNEFPDNWPETIKVSYDAIHDIGLELPDWDVRELEREWREWIADVMEEPPKNPDKAFMGFCRKFVQRRRTG
jgi:plasmid replication initiation protein